MEFQYRGRRPLTGNPGDSIAAALLRAGERVCRQAETGGRGVFCGMGVCSECAVVADGRPGVLACMTPVVEGMRVDVQPVRPPAAAGPGVPPETTLSPDLLVVGAGPAGLACAAVAAEAGLDVVVVDERVKPGGQYYKQQATERPETLDAQFRRGAELIERVRRSGARLLGGVTVWGAFAPDHILATGADARYVFRPRRLVLATGAYERGVPMPGWTLPGVMTTGAAQTLLRSYATPPGRRVLISGNGPLNLQVAAELTRAGVEVVAVAEQADPWSPRRAGQLAVMAACAPGLARDGAGYLATLRRRRVPLLSRSAVVRLDGDEAVHSATVARLDADGRPIAGSERTFEVDAVCTGFGFVPSTEVSRALGCAHRYDAGRDVVEVERDDLGRTSVANVWVIGDGGASLGAKVALAQGLLAGAALAAELAAELAATPAGGSAGTAAAARAYRRHLRFQRALAQVYAAPGLGHRLAEEDTVVCRCENRTLADVRAETGMLSAGAIKRVSRAGMGPCQGRYCGAVLAAIARENSGTPVDERSGFRAQAPFKPVRIGTIADADG